MRAKEGGEVRQAPRTPNQKDRPSFPVCQATAAWAGRRSLWVLRGPLSTVPTAPAPAPAVGAAAVPASSSPGNHKAGMRS